VFLDYHQGVIKGLQWRNLIDNRTKFTSGGAVTGLSGELPLDAETINKSSYSINEDIESFCNALFELGYNDALCYECGS